eukprot:m.1229 g.1229  ORF g.1229 m.1229 type:complete len:78 (+) comp5903_c0_seq1:1980-2213(+)
MWFIRVMFVICNQLSVDVEVFNKTVYLDYGSTKCLDKNSFAAFSNVEERSRDQQTYTEFLHSQVVLRRLKSQLLPKN